jgi:hypothetical protein
MSDPLTLNVTVDASGQAGAVVIEGRDISKYVKGFSVRSGVGRPTEVVLRLVNVRLAPIGMVMIDAGEAK